MEFEETQIRQIAFTKYPELNELLLELTEGLRGVFSHKLIGIYLYGSLIWGDFDEHVSDVDMMAILDEPVRCEELKKLRRLYDGLTDKHPDFSDRLETQFVSKETAATFKTAESRMANVSPGEPLHFVPCNADWTANFYFVQEYGYCLYGCGKGYIAEVTRQEFLSAIKRYAKSFNVRAVHLRSSRPYQAYAVMSLCRAYYTLKTGEQVSKKFACDYAAARLPEYAPLIREAMLWRQNFRRPSPGEHTFTQVRNFLRFMSEKIEGL